MTDKFGLRVQNEAGQRLAEFCQENTLFIANTLFQQHERWLYTWMSPNGQCGNQIDYMLCSQRCRTLIQSAKTRLRDDWGSDSEILIAKFRLKLKKVGKTIRPFRYDLNKIPFNNREEETNGFKGLDLIDRVLCLSKYYGWRFIPLYRRQWLKLSSRRNAKRQMVVWGGLTNSWEKKRREKQRRKGNIFPFECEVPKNSKER